MNVGRGLAPIGSGGANHRRGPRVATDASRGMTLVELMVGLAIGLVVTAACTALWAAQLREERRQGSEARLNEDLRAALALMGHELRRAGYRADVEVAGASATPNPYAAVTPSAAASDTVAFRYSRDATENGRVDDNEQFGFRVKAGVLEAQLGAANWQALTDAATLTVLGLRVEPSLQTLDLEAFCPAPCPPGAGACPPRLERRSFELSLSARLPEDAASARTVGTRVVLRNDTLSGRCAP